MKNFLLLITSVICIHTNAQKTEAYYDYMWKPCQPELARYYSKVTKTDSGWLRYDYFIGTQKLQMKGLYEDSATTLANGNFYFYYANGFPESVGRNLHNKKEGLWLKYYYNGYMEDSTVYVNGKPSGTSLGWHSNGYAADSVVYNPDGSSVEVYWCSNGTPSSAGRMMNGRYNGPWQFFHNNGVPAAKEVYDNGRLVSRQYFKSDGVQEDTTSKDREASFTGGNGGWRKFILKHIYFPSQYKLVNGNSVTVVVRAIVDEDGNVTEPFIEVPFDKHFDDIALDIFKKSPKWMPAIRHNRAVTQVVRQPITFAQD